MVAYRLHRMKRKRERPPSATILIRYTLFADLRELVVRDSEIDHVRSCGSMQFYRRNDQREFICFAAIDARSLDERIVQLRSKTLGFLFRHYSAQKNEYG